jgi:hypothetical protein
MKEYSTTSAGVTTLGVLGTAIAVQISFHLTDNIWWTILHGLLGWFYVVYRCIVGY